MALFLEGEFTLQTTDTRVSRGKGHEECVESGSCVMEIIRRYWVIKRKITPAGCRVSLFCWMFVDASKRSVTMRASSWLQIMHVVEKFRHVVIGCGGECFTFVEFGIYLLKCSICCRILERE